ncbi:MAG: hypothetical protein KUF75_05945 [Candidatus Thiodiazotropha sp. (ex Ctena orbiculata)]|nr:hypothetical protein [Candidatus Thiodiazotropha taylori]
MKVITHKDVNDLPDEESRHTHLTPDKIYLVIGIDDESYRIVDDCLEPTLYRKELFDVLESNYPESWLKTEYEDGEYYIEPPELSAIGFYEDYFDGVESAVLAYRNYLKENGIDIADNNSV